MSGGSGLLQQFRQFGFHQDLIRGHHGDDVPGTDLGTQFAADADHQIDRANAHGITGMARVRYFIDAVHRAHRHTRIASSAQILVQYRELLGKLFLLGHTDVVPCRNRLRFVDSDRIPTRR